MTVDMEGELPQAISLTDLQDLLDRLGDDLSRWPEGQRLAAERLLASSSEARAMLGEAAALRQLLSGQTPRAPEGLKSRILAAALQRDDQAVAAIDDAQPADKKAVPGPA